MTNKNYVIEYWKNDDLYTFVIAARDRKSAREAFLSVRRYPIKSIRRIPEYIDELEYGEHLKKSAGYPAHLLEM
jgi:hypothetical protein